VVGLVDPYRLINRHSDSPETLVSKSSISHGAPNAPVAVTSSISIAGSDLMLIRGS
jgi:hypothetical protein